MTTQLKSTHGFRGQNGKGWIFPNNNEYVWRTEFVGGRNAGYSFGVATSIIDVLTQNNELYYLVRKFFMKKLATMLKVREDVVGFHLHGKTDPIFEYQLPPLPQVPDLRITTWCGVIVKGSNIVESDRYAAFVMPLINWYLSLPESYTGSPKILWEDSSKEVELVFTTKGKQRDFGHAFAEGGGLAHMANRRAGRRVVDDGVEKITPHQPEEDDNTIILNDVNFI